MSYFYCKRRVTRVLLSGFLFIVSGLAQAVQVSNAAPLLSEWFVTDVPYHANDEASLEHMIVCMELKSMHGHANSISAIVDMSDSKPVLTAQGTVKKSKNGELIFRFEDGSGGLGEGKFMRKGSIGTLTLKLLSRPQEEDPTVNRNYGKFQLSKGKCPL